MHTHFYNTNLVNSRIQAGWINWRSGVLCDHSIKTKVKEKYIKLSKASNDSLYGAETRTVRKAHGRKCDVGEVKMVRWMCSIKNG